MYCRSQRSVFLHLVTSELTGILHKLKKIRIFRGVCVCCICRKKKESALVNFWSPLCTIDTSLWYRWFHTNKIILILDQDTYLPRTLLTPSLTHHRYATLQCRIAASKLFTYLKSWSSFVLLENQAFVRFLPSTESPLYFCLLRVAQKHPCIVLHVGHIEGTPHSLQSDTVRELHEALVGLSVEKRVQLTKRSRSSGNTRGGKAAKPCAFLIQKQLQRVMIRFSLETIFFISFVFSNNPLLIFMTKRS